MMFTGSDDDDDDDDDDDGTERENYALLTMNTYRRAKAMFLIILSSCIMNESNKNTIKAIFLRMCGNEA